MDENTKPVVDDNATTDDQEWETAHEEYAENQGAELEKQEEEPADEPEEPKVDEGVSGEDNSGEQPEGDKPVPDPVLGTEEEPAAPEAPEVPEKVETPVDPKTAVRELEADRKEMTGDVEKALYGENPLGLTDADGDPIETIDDVMKLRNPVTGQQFTEEQAAVYLLQANNYLTKEKETRREEVSRVTDLQIELRDKAEATLKQFKPILDQNPQLRSRIWESYRNTLKLDESGKIILEAPIDIQEHFSLALDGYVKMEDQKKMDEAAKAEAETKAKEAEQAAVQAKEEAEKKVEAVRTRADREDVLSTGKTDTRSKEDKEWDQAAKEYYEE